MSIKMQLKMKVDYKDVEKAKKIAQILEADNKLAPKNLEVSSFYKKNKVYSNIKTKRIETLISTADDLLSSQKLAEQILGEN